MLVDVASSGQKVVAAQVHRVVRVALPRVEVLRRGGIAHFLNRMKAFFVEQSWNYQHAKTK